MNYPLAFSFYSVVCICKINRQAKGVHWSLYVAEWVHKKLKCQSTGNFLYLIDWPRKRTHLVQDATCFSHRQSKIKTEK